MVASLMLSASPDAYQGRRHLKRSETRPVLPRHRFVLELHLAGKSVQEICELSQYSPAMVYRILESEDVIALRQQIMSYYDQEFEALFPDVIQAVREGLVADDMSHRLDAAKTWLKAHGKFSSESKPIQQFNLTAEDVVFNILNQRQDDSRSPSG